MTLCVVVPFFGLRRLLAINETCLPGQQVTAFLTDFSSLHFQGAHGPQKGAHQATDERLHGLGPGSPQGHVQTVSASAELRTEQIAGQAVEVSTLLLFYAIPHYTILQYIYITRNGGIRSRCETETRIWLRKRWGMDHLRSVFYKPHFSARQRSHPQGVGSRPSLVKGFPSRQGIASEGGLYCQKGEVSYTEDIQLQPSK